LAASKERDEAARIKKEMADAANSMRLKVEHIDKIPRWIEKRVKSFGVDFKIKRFDVEFRQNISVRYNSPIGKKSNQNDTYPGWKGQISGTTNIGYSNPIKLLSGENITSCSDIFKYNKVIAGIYVGCGVGAENFSYSITMFAEDFPKINSKYEEFRKLDSLRIRAAEEALRLKRIAGADLVDKDKELRDINAAIIFLNKKTEEATKLWENRERSIMRSKAYKDAITLGPEFAYDVDALAELRKNFK